MASGFIGDLWYALRGDSQQLEQDARRGGLRAGDSMGSGIARGIRNQSRLLAGAGGAAAGIFAADAAASFGQFQGSMQEVFTLLPGISQAAMDDMESQVKQFSTEFGRLPDEVVPALYQSLSAGVPQDNVFAFLETANKLAVGGVASTEEAVGLLAAVTKGYGDTSEEATKRTSDLLFNTVRLGTTTIPELAASLGKAVPQAAALNVAQEELLGTTAGLTGVTGNTAEVTTQLQGIFTALLKPTAEMSRGLQDIGFESGSAAIEALGLQGTLEALRASTGGNDEAFARMLGRAQALTAGLAITEGRAEAVASNIEEMGDATGATDEAFETMDQGVQATANRIAARMKVLAIEVGGFLEPVAPLLVAFGPVIGRTLGGVFGFAFTMVATAIPKPLMAPVIGAMVTTLGSSRVANAIGAALSGPRMRSVLNLTGSKWGKVLGAGAALAMGLIIIDKFNELQEVAAANREAVENIDEDMAAQLEEGRTRQELEQQLADLRSIREEAGGVQGTLLDVGGLGEGNVLGSVFDVAFGANPTEVLNRQINTLEAVIDGRLPGLVESGERVGEAVTEGVEESIDDGMLSIEEQVAAYEALGIISDDIEDTGMAAAEATPEIEDLGAALSTVANTSIKDLKDQSQDADKAWRKIIGGTDDNRRRLRQINRELERWDRRRRRAIRENDSQALAFAETRIAELQGEQTERQKVVDKIRAERRALRGVKRDAEAIPNEVGVDVDVDVNAEGPIRAVATVVGGSVVRPQFRQSGGRAVAGQPYWVGEAGRRELFVPTESGRIVPEQQTQRAGGDVTINLTTEGLPMRARTPLEVVQQLRRGARMGLSPVRQQTFDR